MAWLINLLTLLSRLEIWPQKIVQALPTQYV